MNATDPELIPLNRVPRHIRSPSPPHLSTVVRWAMRGVGSPPVRLATTKVGGRRFTTAAALAEFIAATSGLAGVTPPSVRDERRQTAVRMAEQELDAEGLR